MASPAQRRTVRRFSPSPACGATEGDDAGVVDVRPDGRLEAVGPDDARPTDEALGRDAGDVDGTPPRTELELLAAALEASGDAVRGVSEARGVEMGVERWGAVVIFVGAMERGVERDDGLGAADGVRADVDTGVLDALVALTPTTVGAAWEPPRPQPVSAAMPAVARITTAVRRIGDDLAGASFGVGTVISCTGRPIRLAATHGRPVVFPVSRGLCAEWLPPSACADVSEPRYG